MVAHTEKEWKLLLIKRLMIAATLSIAVVAGLVGTGMMPRCNVFMALNGECK